MYIRVSQDGGKREEYMSAKVNSRITVHQGKMFRLVRENITLGNDVTVDLDIIRHPGASAIVPLYDDNTVLMIKQYRHAIGDFIWEIPAGTLNLNETPLECAKRELVEETGFVGSLWHKLGEITPLPAYSDERIHLFVCAKLVAAEQNLDKDEMIDVHKCTVDNIMEMIESGVIQDGKTIIALFMATHWLKKKTDS
jgi:ADP-ribose pyrophosphatase